jgi:hypothetical protein
MSYSVLEGAGDSAVIAFYGFSHTTAKIAAAFDLFLAWFELLGFPPMKLAIVSGQKIGKLIDFANGTGILRQNKFDQVTAFEMYAPLPGSVAAMTEFTLAASYQGERDGSCVSFAANTRVASLSDSRTERLVRDLMPILRPEYGIGFIRPTKLGPMFYVIGILMSTERAVAIGKEYEDQRRICRWGDIAMPRQVYREGIIRDVYPCNYLNNVHLQQPVGNVTLENWIRQDARRGALERFTDEISRWQVEPGETETICNSLNDAGLIFDWHRYI